MPVGVYCSISYAEKNIKGGVPPPHKTLQSKIGRDHTPKTVTTTRGVLNILVICYVLVFCYFVVRLKCPVCWITKTNIYGVRAERSAGEG